MNKFEIERFDLLGNVKTDVAKQRSWIRNCLNEHSLERYTMAILSNENLIREFYEDWCLLLDKEFNSTIPMLVSGLQSILFAINIDNPSFNVSTKIAVLKTTDQNVTQISTESSEPIKIKNKTSSSSTSFGGNSLENSELIAIKIKKSNKIRKNNVVVFDIEDDAEEEMNNQRNELNNLDEENVLAQCSIKSSHSNDVQDQVGILTNPIKYSKNSSYSK